MTSQERRCKSIRTYLVHALATVGRAKLAETPLTRGDNLERMTGIEPALSAWEADVLPLNYIRWTANCQTAAVA